MRSTFHALEVAKRGLYAQQTAINTTGHNIANANTPGFSRQRVEFTAAKPMEMPAMNRSVAPGQLGTGVNFASIKRIRESFLDMQFRNEANSYGHWQVQHDTLSKIEQIFNEPSSNGLRSVIDQFWNSWQDLSREPENMTSRAVVKERAIAMLDAFQHADTKLKELEQDLDNAIDVKVKQANGLMEQIANLNQSIRRIEGQGQNANDLRDQRDHLTDQLAQLVKIEVQEDPQSRMYTITMAGRDENLVDGINFNALDLTDADDYAALSNFDVNRGEIAGLFKSKDKIVNDYQAHLDTMFRGLIEGEVSVHIPQGSVIMDPVTGEPRTITEPGGETVTVNGINGLHQLGWTLNNDENGQAAAGQEFFVRINPDEDGIQNYRLNPDINNNLANIAASLRIDDNGQVFRGNGQLALSLGQLRDNVFSFTSDTVANRNTSFDEYYRSVIGELGVQAQEANRQTNNQFSIMQSVENRRESVSGVSLDEEMTNLIKFQHAYNASARMTTTVDQMLDTIINRMGIVGR